MPFFSELDSGAARLPTDNVKQLVEEEGEKLRKKMSYEKRKMKAALVGIKVGLLHSLFCDFDWQEGFGDQDVLNVSAAKRSKLPPTRFGHDFREM